jgi:hypothetical protein
MRPRKRSWWAFFVVVLVGLGRTVAAQNPAGKLGEELQGQPLYLSGFWMSDKLEFDGAGHLKGKSDIGPVTLSGVDVKSVAVDGREMVIHGERVGLVADGDGRLVRRVIHSTTLIVPSLRRGDGNKFRANEELSVKVHADADGSFDTALKTIFANGLAELATSVPEYWKCYAKGYFEQEIASSEAEKAVQACVAGRSLAPDVERGDDFVPPKLLSTVDPNFSGRAAELGVSGVSRIHFTVSRHGIPVGFQIVEAVGAGLDEATLAAVYQYKFQPATSSGNPVAADSDFSLHYKQ